MEVIAKRTGMKKCPECGGPVEKVITAAAVQFKGSGWYVTDYTKGSSGTAASEGSREGKKDEKTKTESSAKETSSKKESSAREGSSRKTEKHK